jgi:nicotinamide-nucleotide amidase
MTGSDAPEEVVRLLTAARRTVGIAESLTGGQVISALVDVPGASAVVRGGVVAYSTALKSSLLAVDADLLASRGPVDGTVAAQMAEGVRAACAISGDPADIGLATTGVAGPDPLGDAPVGLVFIAVSDRDGSLVREYRFAGDRSAIRTSATAAALNLLRERLGG